MAARLRQAVRDHRAAEPGTDHDCIEVFLHHGHRQTIAAMMPAGNVISAPTHMKPKSAPSLGRRTSFVA
jgi:hypothetical protein